MTTSVDVAAVWEAAEASLVPTSSDGTRLDVSDTLQAWNEATAFLRPVPLDDSRHGLDPSQRVVDAVNLLHSVGLVPRLLGWLIGQEEACFESIICGEVERHLARGDLSNLLIRLATYLQVWIQPYQALNMQGFNPQELSSLNPPAQFRLSFLNRLHRCLTRADFLAAWRQFFVNYLNLPIDNGKSPQDMPYSQTPAQIPVEMQNTIRAMHYLGLMERFEPAVFTLVYTFIDDRIDQVAVADFSSNDIIGDLLRWLQTDIGTRLATMSALAFTDDSTNEAASQAILLRVHKSLRHSMQRFEWYIYSRLFRMRVDDLFDIIVDYPTSLPGVQDLKTCLDKVDQRDYLVKHFGAQIKKRLLHPGADTKDIISQYVNIVRVLRIVDPAGLLLARVASPIRLYLRNRPDTIRCIVHGMVDEDNELLRELLQGNPADTAGLPSNGSSAGLLHSNDENEVDDFRDDNLCWIPAPVNAPVNFARNSAADVIQLLVSIYDSKEAFVQELQALHATRLLRVTSYDYSREVRNIEILKMRFGDQALAGLEVMLKDCADSKRIDSALHAQDPVAGRVNAPSNAHATIISHLYWPENGQWNFRLPRLLSSCVKAYSKAYHSLKPEKSLKWIPSKGSVEIVIERAGSQVTMRVSPLQASVLEIIAEKPASLIAVQEALSITNIDVLKATLRFWEGKSVIKCMPGDSADDEQVWAAAEDAEDLVADNGDPAVSKSPEPPEEDIVIAPEDSASLADTIREAEMQDMRQFEKAIDGVLTNLGALPAERLHRILEAIAPGYSPRSLVTLEAFLIIAEMDGIVYRTDQGHWMATPPMT